MDLVNIIPQLDDEEAPFSLSEKAWKSEISISTWIGGVGGENQFSAKEVLLVFNFSPQFITTEWAFIGTALPTACGSL